jgi:hypothetical protein
MCSAIANAATLQTRAPPGFTLAPFSLRITSILFFLTWYLQFGKTVSDENK